MCSFLLFVLCSAAGLIRWSDRRHLPLVPGTFIYPEFAVFGVRSLCYSCLVVSPVFQLPVVLPVCSLLCLDYSLVVCELLLRWWPSQFGLFVPLQFPRYQGHPRTSPVLDSSACSSTSFLFSLINLFHSHLDPCLFCSWHNDLIIHWSREHLGVKRHFIKQKCWDGTLSWTDPGYGSRCLGLGSAGIGINIPCCSTPEPCRSRQQTTTAIHF